MIKSNDGENIQWDWYKVNTAANYLKISYHNNNYAIIVGRVPQDKTYLETLRIRSITKERLRVFEY